MAAPEPDPGNYYAALLRLWRDGPDGPWHASLRHSAGGEPLGFADIEHLCAYLLRLTDGRRDTDHTAAQPPGHSDRGQ